MIDEKKLMLKLIRQAVLPMLESCGNSYVNAHIETWLVAARIVGAYNGPVRGDVKEVAAAFEEELGDEGGLPKISRETDLKFVLVPPTNSELGDCYPEIFDTGFWHQITAVGDKWNTYADRTTGEEFDCEHFWKMLNEISGGE